MDGFAHQCVERGLLLGKSCGGSSIQSTAKGRHHKVVDWGAEEICNQGTLHQSSPTPSEAWHRCRVNI